MYITSLTISGKNGIIRDITFHEGLNLIVDETPDSNDKETGNNVGKTTVLKLIDFCLGGKPNPIYTDSESKKEYKRVKEFLLENKVLITLILKKDLSSKDSEEIRSRRNG